ncbi:MAG: RNA-directed DNA polymerase [Syntrophales bacterium]|nr:RNA-directed DNA polymerase [Syntrophales bacterium]
MPREEIQIEGVPFDINLLVKQLKQDMRDDWFPDPLNYEDVLKAEVITKKFAEYKKSNNKPYNGFEARQYNIPKQGFVLRYALEMSLWDRIIYQGIAKYLISFCDHHLSTSVFSHRWTGKPNSKYIFRQPIDAWKQFQNAIKVNLSSENPWLVVTDVQNFFENIRINDVEVCLNQVLSQSKLSPRDTERTGRAVKILKRLLTKWTPYGQHGIPQNRDSSSFIGNMIMHNVDRVMLDKGYIYYRYMDDIRLICRDEFHARRALKELIIELRKVGLNVNSKKSFIVSKDSEQIEEYIFKPDREIEQIDALWKTKRLFDVRKSLPLLRKMTLQLIANDQTQERRFRFCINRLEQIARCKETRNSFDFSKITDTVIAELINQPYSTDSFVRYLKCVDLTKTQLKSLFTILTDSSKNIYSWQNYHLWQLLVNHNFRSDILIQAAKDSIGPSIAEPNVAGAILYLGACGDDTDKAWIAGQFNNFRSYIVQRHAMVATHELDYKKYVKPLMQEYVREDLKGTYRTLATSYRGTYYRPLEPVSVTEIYRNIPAYD